MATSSCKFFMVATAFLVLNSCITHSQKADQPIQFTYSGPTGPEKWASLSPNFSMCAKGKLQSPINIVTKKCLLDKKLKPLIREYNAANVTLINNEFNVGIRFPDNSGTLLVDGKKYMLKQMHWHAPSEHHIDGEQFAAELHLVHVAEDGSVSVVALLFRDGHPDPLVEKIQNKLNTLAKEAQSHEEFPIPVGPFHPTEVRKDSHKYYRYIGSFTTPPCTENVVWNIVGKVRSISREQVEALRAPLDLRCKKNSRPVQPMNGRQVEMYEETTGSGKSPDTGRRRLFV